MSLLLNVVARYGASYLANLTNPETPGATAYDATRLGYACTDVEALFRIHAGVEYSDSDARHVAVACPIVITMLEIGLGKIKRREAMDAVVGSLGALGMVTGRAKVIPTTNSGLTPSPDIEGGTLTLAPAFDKDRFEKFLADGPAASTDT